MVNIIGTLNVFEAARHAGRSVRVVYAEFLGLSGVPEEAYASGKLSEAEPLKPSTHYGVFKQANEGNARAFYQVDGISSIGLRPWTVYGVGRDAGLTAGPSLAIKAVALSGVRSRSGLQALWTFNTLKMLPGRSSNAFFPTRRSARIQPGRLGSDDRGVHPGTPSASPPAPQS